QRWNGAAVTAEDVPELAAQLEAEGARQYAQDAASRLTQQALDMLSQAKPQGAANLALQQLTEQLITREA
ncbi:MAG: hypothetical protein OEZ02_04000, partial [Anaerolineae bacterium]|nr:hypothetical protein [Anaerolineae bacterium]